MRRFLPRHRTRVAVVLALLVPIAHPLPAAAQTDSTRLPAPAYPGATSLSEQGRYVEALSALARELPQAGVESPIEAQLLRAVLLAASSRHLESVQIWRDIAAREQSLATLARRSQVGSLTAAGRPHDARLVLRELIEGAGIRPYLDLVVLVADGLRRAGDAEGAASLYSQVLGAQVEGAESDAARLGLATLHEQEARYEQAIALLRQAQLRHRLPSTYAVASARERTLATQLGRSPERFTEDEYLALSRRLSRASRFPAALTVLNEWRLRHPESDRADQIDADAIENLYDQRANDQARARIDAFRLDHRTSPLLPRVRLTEFRLDAREGRTADTIAKGFELWRGEIPGTTPTVRHGAGLLLGAYLIGAGRVEEGVRVFDGLAEAMEEGDERTTIRWRAAVGTLRANRNEQAVERFRDLSRESLSGELAPATLYWLGEAEERVGNRQAALQAWVRVEQRHPYHYYGRRASERLADRSRDPQLRGAIVELRRQEAVPPVAFPPAQLTQAAQGFPELRAARLLSAAGLRREALAAAREALGRARTDRGLALLTTRAAADAGDHRLALALVVTHFGQFLERRASNLPDDFWALVYPQPFPLDVRRAAADRDLDPLLLYALMRQESRFDPEARSSVGAIGLFQIMPATAGELAPFTGLTPDEDALLDPAVNARFAATLVSRLMLQFNALAPVIASYNAGAERVSSWWETARGLPDDLFIDSIPYTETRRFVREVLNNYFAYRELVGEESGGR